MIGTVGGKLFPRSLVRYDVRLRAHSRNAHLAILQRPIYGFLFYLVLMASSGFVVNFKTGHPPSADARRRSWATWACRIQVDGFDEKMAEPVASKCLLKWSDSLIAPAACSDDGGFQQRASL